MTDIQREFIKHLGTGLANTYQDGIKYIAKLLDEIKEDEKMLSFIKSLKGNEESIGRYVKMIEEKKGWITETREGFLLRSKEVKNIINDLEKLFESDL